MTVATDMPSPWRNGFLAAVLLVLGIVLAACSSGGQLEGGGGGTPGPSGKTVPPVMLQQLTGIPPDKARSLTEALALTGGQHDIGIVEGEFQSGTFSLTARFRGEQPGGTVRISYSFELRDSDGVLIDTIAGSEAAGPAAGDDPWAAVQPSLLQRIAGSATRQMAKTLSKMGYATRVGSLIMPPAHAFVAAGPGAHLDIDLETLNGPSAIEPVALPPVEPDLAAVAPEPEVPPPPAEDAVKSDTVEIKVVAVVAVEGSPGGGNGELTKAMRATLKAAGWPVVNEPRADALVVRGKVDLSKPQGGNQKVALSWVVETPQGKPLGDVKQANSVPAGALDSGWGPAAQVVTEAAAGGIFEIIKKYR